MVAVSVEAGVGSAARRAWRSCADRIGSRIPFFKRRAQRAVELDGSMVAVSVEEDVGSAARRAFARSYADRFGVRVFLS